MSQTPVMFFFAFIAVLVMIGAAAWLVRRFAGNRLGANANRGRMPRLAVIDAAAVDGRRRLVLVRRDNVEHLLMIGGPSDIVVEPNIVRASPGREAAPQRPSHGEPRLSAEIGAWDDAGAEPEAALPELPPVPPRPLRPSFAEEARRAPPMPAPDRRNDPFAGLVPEPISRPEPRPEPRPELRPEPRAELRPEPRPEPRVEAPRPRPEPAMPRPPRPEAAPLPKAPPLRAERPVPPPAPPAPPPPPAPNALSEADQNLAEMANRLEAALRRPPTEPIAEPRRSEPRAPEPRVGAPPVAPEPAPRPAEPAAAPPAPKTGFDSLEEEMASLLGRPKSSS